MRTMTAVVILLLVSMARGVEPGHVSDSPHNLSIYRPGQTPPREQAVCAPCHTPHVARAVEPLWDPEERKSAKPANAPDPDVFDGQPNGSSKTCLLCHDGVIAAGNIVTRNQQIASAARMTSVSPDHPLSGTDLSDDHPSSFRYDAQLAKQHPWLNDPSSLVNSGQLDARGQVQCRSCHDPHDNSNGKFLVATTAGSALCRTCHQMGVTTVPDHADCMGCHQSHTAPSGIRLLRADTISDTCLKCHSGGTLKPQGPNVGADLRKFENHDTNPPIELANHATDETACNDCHEPHTMRVAKSTPPAIRGNFGAQSGVTATGSPREHAQFEYEVCFKCHGDRQDLEPRISRATFQSNWRLKFSTSAVSFHPIEARGVNPYVPSLLPPYTPGSIIYCTDCHSSDTGTRAGEFGANGPHGSETPGLLIARYDTTDYTNESADAYAACYRCHNRNSILSDQSFKKHKIHIVDTHTPCSACHDSHGISSAQGTRQHNSHLINFDIRIVQKSSTGLIEYDSTGLRSGSCTLKCHGVDHIGFTY